MLVEQRLQRDADLDRGGIGPGDRRQFLRAIALRHAFQRVALVRRQHRDMPGIMQ